MSDIVCEHCGLSNPAGSAFCGYCSRPLQPGADRTVQLPQQAWPGDAPPPVPGSAPPQPTVTYTPVGAPVPEVGPYTCAVCGYVLGAMDGVCARCKTPRGMSVNPDAVVPGTYMPTAAGWPGVIGNTSGQRTQVPPEVVGGFNWGGCTLGCVWAFAMGLPVWGAAALLSTLCCTVANLPIGLVLGIKGNEWAWQNRRFDSIEHFRAVQRKWAMWGIVVAVAGALFYAAYIVLVVWLEAVGSLN